MIFTAFSDLDSLEFAVKREFDNCFDLCVRRVDLDGAKALICTVGGLADKNYVSEKILRPLMNYGDYRRFSDLGAVLQVSAVTAADDIRDICASLCAGGACVAVDNGNVFCALCPAETYFGRSASKSETDITIKGAQTAFVEDMEKNIVMLRRMIRSPMLKYEQFTKGNVTRTRIAMLYIENRASEKCVASVREKLSGIGVDVITDSGNIESLMRNNKYGIFPSFGSTEKADKAASLLSAGRIVIICDGSPFVLTAPYIFIEALQSAEDYLRSPFYATFMRLLRFASLLAALYLPSVFLILADMRHELLPDGIYEVIDKLRRDIPIPLFHELLLMLIVFEMLREVGLRMPRSVGDAVGIVGSIIIGDAATKAGIASTAVILVVAVSAVANFVVPVYMNTTSLLRLLFLIASYAAGFAGLAASSCAVVCVLCAKRELGVPYLLGISPFRADFMLDFILAIPQKTLGKREEL